MQWKELFGYLITNRNLWFVLKIKYGKFKEQLLLKNNYFIRTFIMVRIFSQINKFYIFSVLRIFLLNYSIHLETTKKYSEKGKTNSWNVLIENNN